MTIPPKYVDSSDHHERVLPELAALDAALQRANELGYAAITAKSVSAMLTAAADVLRAEGAAAERAAIVKLARDTNATCDFTEHAPDGSHVLHRSRAFADLLGDAP